MSFFDDQESGLMCSGCGAYMGKSIAGYCSRSCERDYNPVMPRNPNPNEKVKCKQCDKWLAPTGIDQHMKAKHDNSRGKYG